MVAPTDVSVLVFRTRTRHQQRGVLGTSSDGTQQSGPRLSAECSEQGGEDPSTVNAGLRVCLLCVRWWGGAGEPVFLRTCLFELKLLESYASILRQFVTEVSEVQGGDAAGGGPLSWSHDEDAAYQTVLEAPRQTTQTTSTST